MKYKFEPEKHASDKLLPYSGLQALKVILEKNEPRKPSKFLGWLKEKVGYGQTNTA